MGISIRVVNIAKEREIEENNKTKQIKYATSNEMYKWKHVVFDMLTQNIDLHTILELNERHGSWLNELKLKLHSELHTSQVGTWYKVYFFFLPK